MNTTARADIFRILHWFCPAFGFDAIFGVFLSEEYEHSDISIVELIRMYSEVGIPANCYSAEDIIEHLKPEYKQTARDIYLEAEMANL